MPMDDVFTAVGRLGDKTTTLTRAFDNLTAQVKQQTDFGRRNRLLIKLLAGSFAFDVILTVVLALTVGSVHRVANEAKAATTSARVAQNNLKAACEGANRANAATLGLFERLAAAGPKPATPEAARKQATALADIRRTYASQKC